MARPWPFAAEPSVPTLLSPAVTGVPAAGAEAVEAHRHHARARAAAVRHARDDLLADEAALVEIDAVKLIHVGLVREGIAVDEVEPAARHAERDAVRFVVRGIDQLRAEIGGGLTGKMRRQHAAQAKLRQPRIGDSDRPTEVCALPPQAASTPSASDRSSTMTLARSL